MSFIRARSCKDSYLKMRFYKICIISLFNLYWIAPYIVNFQGKMINKILLTSISSLVVFKEMDIDKFYISNISACIFALFLLSFSEPVTVIFTSGISLWYGHYLLYNIYDPTFHTPTSSFLFIVLFIFINWGGIKLIMLELIYAPIHEVRTKFYSDKRFLLCKKVTNNYHEPLFSHWTLIVPNCHNTTYFPFVHLTWFWP